MRLKPSVVVLFIALLLSGCASLKENRRAERVGIEWVTIPGGRFVMGDTFTIDNPDSLPLHEVDLEDYRMMRYEVTYYQYDQFAEATGRRLPEAIDGVRGDRAVEGVDWDEASAFCAWLGARLPSEAEWEYAAAGGADKQLWAGTDNEDEMGDYVRYRRNATANPGEVGRKKPNRFGLYDMSGNVAEWIGAYYQYYPEPDEEPSRYDLETFNIRIIRGGSYTMDEDVVKTYWRAGTLKDVQSTGIGFRCAQGV